jgi:hypothetical protein
MSQAPIEQAVPLVRRALKVLTDREVTPQLGLLKSTLLQLDSTFSERTYGVSSFRDFAEKLAAAGHVTLRESGRNVLVELKEDAVRHHRGRDERDQPQDAVDAPESRPDSREPRSADGIREIRRLFQSAPNPPRWPMYVRQAKQFLRNVDPAFDERKFGFGNVTDLFRACQRDGLFRVERDRQGVIRLFPGNVMQPVPGDETDERRAAVGEPAAAPADQPEAPAAEADVVDADVVQEIETPEIVDAVEAAPAEAVRPSRGRGRRSAQPKGDRRRGKKAHEDSGQPRKAAPKSRPPRRRKPEASPVEG